MTPLQILQRARKRISKGWCQGDIARDRNQLPVRSNSKKAVAWCLAGACGSDTGPHWSPPTSRVFDFLWGIVGQPMVYYNDAPRRTKKQVLAVIDKAIKLCKREARK